MPSAKKKPLTSAERARNYRQRKALEAKAAAEAQAAERDNSRDAGTERDAAAIDTPSKPRAIVLRDSVADAIAHMKWLKPTDSALSDMALMYAGMIDDLVAEDPTATGKAASLGQLLARLMTQLGGAPTVRLQHELRSLRLLAGVAGEGGTDGTSDDEQRSHEGTPGGEGADVIPIRPAKRKRA